MRPSITVAIVATIAATAALPLSSVDVGSAGTGIASVTIGPTWFTEIGGSTPELIVSAEDWGLLSNGTINNSGDYAKTFDDYFTARAKQGYNGVEVSLFSFTGLTGANDGDDWDGVFPFTPSTDPTTAANSAFWARRDYFLSSAASHGFRVFLNVTTPFLDAGAFTASWTNTQWTALGTFLAGRYAAQTNIMWIVGDDYFGDHDSGLNALLTALRAGGANQPISIQYYQEASSRKDIFNGSTLAWGSGNAQYNWGYSYNVSYDVVEKMGLEANPIPYLWADGLFLASGTTGITDVNLVRRMVWWALSSGSKGFNVGDNDMWTWPSTAYGQIAAKSFYTSQVPAISTYFRSLPNWHLLIADTSSQLVTAGRGTHASPITSGGSGTPYTSNSDAYVTASRTPDGTLAVIYMSHPSTITIDQTKMVAGYTATWVDPADGTTSAATPGTTYNSGSEGTNSVGDADWVLVLKQATSTSTTAVRFSKVQYDSPGHDTGNNKSLNDEWVVVINHGHRAKQLSGWSIRDRQGHVFKFPTFKLRPGKSVKLHTGRGTNSNKDLYWKQTGYVWNNTGDKAILKNKSKTVVDTCKWGDGDGRTAC